MNKGIFVTATQTDCGKTYITRMIINYLIENNVDCSYFKAAMSDAVIKDGKIIGNDSSYILDGTSIKDTQEEICPYIFCESVSPHLASRNLGIKISKEVIIDSFNKIKSKHDYIVCEGSGGIICPIVFEDDEHFMLEDFMKITNYPLLLIIDSKVGTINQTVLTVEHLKKQGFKLIGIIMNNYEDTVLVNDNIHVIENLTKEKIILKVKKNQKSVNDSKFLEYLL